MTTHLVTIATVFYAVSEGKANSRRRENFLENEKINKKTSKTRTTFERGGCHAQLKCILELANKLIWFKRGWFAEYICLQRRRALLIFPPFMTVAIGKKQLTSLAES